MQNNNQISLRPAWRNHWVLITFIVIISLISLGLSASPEEVEKALTAAFWAFTILFVLILLYKRYSWKFTVDEQRISRHYGIIARNQQSIRIKDLRSVELNQTLFQRLFGVGDLAFYSAGSAEAEVQFHGILYPSKIRDIVYNLAEQATSSSD